MGKYEKDIPRIREKIAKEFSPEKIILFGSYAWGEPNEDSDLDLFIIKNSDKRRIDRAREIRTRLFGMGVPMDILVYTPKEVEDRLELEDPFVVNILKKGRVIYPS